MSLILVEELGGMRTLGRPACEIDDLERRCVLRVVGSITSDACSWSGVLECAVGRGGNSGSSVSSGNAPILCLGETEGPVLSSREDSMPSSARVGLPRVGGDGVGLRNSSRSVGELRLAGGCGSVGCPVRALLDGSSVVRRSASCCVSNQAVYSGDSRMSAAFCSSIPAFARMAFLMEFLVSMPRTQLFG